MVIVAGPSAVGKSTLVARIVEDLNVFEDTKTYTTRPMRENESPGDPYHHVTNEEFVKLKADGFFVEWAQVHTNYYGTPKHQIDDAWEKGKVIIMDVDVKGAKTFKGIYPEALTVFVHPPEFNELRRRLVSRDGAQAKDLDLRLKNAEDEISQADFFDVQLVNDDLEKSYAKFKKLVEDFIEHK